MLEVTHLRKSFGELLAVDDVSFTLDEGETFGLLGPNGAGKTTTISIICGLSAADSGEVTVAGTTIRPGRTAGRADIYQ